MGWYYGETQPTFIATMKTMAAANITALGAAILGRHARGARKRASANNRLGLNRIRRVSTTLLVAPEISGRCREGCRMGFRPTGRVFLRRRCPNRYTCSDSLRWHRQRRSVNSEMGSIRYRISTYYSTQHLLRLPFAHEGIGISRQSVRRARFQARV